MDLAAGQLLVLFAMSHVRQQMVQLLCTNLVNVAHRTGHACRAQSIDISIMMGHACRAQSIDISIKPDIDLSVHGKDEFVMNIYCLGLNM